MTKTTPRPGELIHFYVNAFSFMTSESQASGVTSRRGMQCVVTADMISANRDRTGISFLDLTPAEQVEKFGFEVWGHGPTPVDLDPFTVGTVEFDLARDEARRLAWLEPNTRLRQEKLAAVHDKFGRAPSDQRSSFSPGDTERDQQLREAGLKA
jgi:hypothetical protein